MRTRFAGVCGTDVGLLSGLYGFAGVPGHEFVGVVESGPDALVGRRVVAEINIACGDCDPCRRAQAKHCARRRVVGIRGADGAFAEWLCVPTTNLHVVPDHVADRDAVFTEPLAAALDVPRRVLVGRRDRILVVGAGRLGQLVARVLVGQCGGLDVLGRDPGKLSRLPAGAGTPGDGVEPGSYDIVVDCSGSADGFEAALAAVRPEGSLVVKSTVPGLLAVDMTYAVVNEIRVIGSRCGPFAEALGLIGGGALDLDSLVDDVYPLSEGPRALRRASEPGVLKVLIDAQR